MPILVFWPFFSLRVRKKWQYFYFRSEVWSYRRFHVKGFKCWQFGNNSGNSDRILLRVSRNGYLWASGENVGIAYSFDLMFPISLQRAIFRDIRTSSVDFWLDKLKVCRISIVYAAVVCPSVRLSVTSWYRTKMGKHKITETVPHDSQGL